MQFIEEYLPLFKSLFKGREDVYAVRLEKGKTNGYFPAYSYDPYHYKAHRLKGGTFQNYSDKKLQRLNDYALKKHLTGQQFIGIYPLLEDNSSWFIVADFDEGDWAASARCFMKECNKHQINCYLERSRSGNGGHVWIFFEKAIPANKSRKVVFDLLVAAGIVSSFDNNGSFDRLFPNQDSLSGKGMGNLIALPLNGISAQNYNTCFIDPTALIAYENQWTFLETIQRNTADHFMRLLEKIEIKSSTAPDNVTGGSAKLIILLENKIRLNKSAITPKLQAFLKDELNIANSEFIIKKKAGRNTFGIDRYFKIIEETEVELSIPKGFAGKLIRFCRDQHIPFDFKDERQVKRQVLFSFNGALWPQQEVAFQHIGKKDVGGIVAPPGSGKTILALKLIKDRQQPTLIVVHRKQLLDQWIERIESFMGIPKKDIGKISNGRRSCSSSITVATIQSLAKLDEEACCNDYGMVIIDECHHVPANTFRKTISQFNSKYLFGLTATPFRKYSDGKLIFIYLGEIIAELASKPSGSGEPKVVIRNTELDVPYNPKTDVFEVLSKILVHDSQRNKLIISDIIKELQLNKKVVILTERTDHLASLEQYLKQSFETIILSGEDSQTSRKAKFGLLKEGNFQILITTGQFFGEGTDIQNIECLFLVYPFAFEGKLVQYIGRVQRSEIAPIIYDYRDIKIDYLNKMFLKRNAYYQKIKTQRTLFDFPDEMEEAQILKTPKQIMINRSVKIKFVELEFLYGSVQFVVSVPEYKEPLNINIQNNHIRPEFEVLKPYFAKAFGADYIKADINGVVNPEGILIALNAESEDLMRVNREIIENVRFQFIAQKFLGKRAKLVFKNENIEGLHQIAESLYEDMEVLLADIITNGDFKHQLQIKYLAELHQGKILKLRYMLMPFSFIFLLSGIENDYLVMETLDLEEATYVWQVPKDAALMTMALKEIDKQLNIIRLEGKQLFLDQSPDNFFRILHDYADKRKGFLVWKDQLETYLY